MYRAKEGGRGRYVYFEERMNVAAPRAGEPRARASQRDRTQRVLAVVPAAARRALGAHFSRGGFSALGLPGRETRTPADFLQLAEETGLIEPIG
jgi:hypothetical protein